MVNRLHELQSQGINVRTLDGLVNTCALNKVAPLLIGLLFGLAAVERSLIEELTEESVEYKRATGGSVGG